MNIKGIVYNLFFKPFKEKDYLLGEKSVLYETASIINNLNKKEKIKIGNNTHIKGELLVFGHGGEIKIGDFCFVGRNTYIWSAKKISIGNRVLISHNCNIFDNDTHPLDIVERHNHFKEIIEHGQPRTINLREREIVIDDDVLIGANSIILKGVHIGQGAIIAAGSFVASNVEPFTVVAGNPAVIIKKIRPAVDVAIIG